MRKNTLSLLLGILLLTACNLPTRAVDTAPTLDPVGTQVSQLLTAMPSATSAGMPETQPTEISALEATQTPSAQATNTPAPDPTEIAPSPTSPAGDPKNSLGSPTWHDTLDTSKSFYLFENENTKVTQSNGALLLTGVSANGWIGWSLTYSHPAKNFYIEGMFTSPACSGSDLYGLVFRTPDADSGYFFGVTCDGKYSLHARNIKDGSDDALISGTANPAILTGANQTNRLGVMANGDKIGLYVNGTLLQEVTDSTYPDEGNFGAFVAANATNGFTANMDEISLWKLP